MNSGIKRFPGTKGTIYTGITLTMLVLFLSGCATLLMKNNQEVTVHTHNPDAVVYVNDNHEGNGSSVVVTVPRGQSVPIRVEAEGHKTGYEAMLPVQRGAQFRKLYLLNVFSPGFLGFLIDLSSKKTLDFKSEYALDMSGNAWMTRDDSLHKQVYRCTIHTDSFTWVNLHLHLSEDSSKMARELDEELMALERQGSYAGRYGHVLFHAPPDPYKLPRPSLKDSMEYGSEAEFFVKELFQNTGFTDSSGTVDWDPVNGLFISCYLHRGVYITYTGRKGFRQAKAQLSGLWVLRNYYGEIMDTISITGYSGNFIPGRISEFSRMSSGDGSRMESVAAKAGIDALLDMLLQLEQSEVFGKHIRLEEDLNTHTGTLTLNRPDTAATTAAQLRETAVSIKNGEQYATGFVVGKEGYIVTTYDNVAGTRPGTNQNLSVMLGKKEFPAQIIRYDYRTNLALLKIEHHFPFAVVLPDSITANAFTGIYSVTCSPDPEIANGQRTGLVSSTYRESQNSQLQLNLSCTKSELGGPVFDEENNLLGMLVAPEIQGQTGNSFAIPAHQIKKVLEITYAE